MTVRRINSVVAEEAVNNLRRLFQVVNKQSKNEASESGLSGPQLWAIKVLSDEVGNSITVSKLAQRMCLNSSTVVRILDSLEAKDLVKRERSVNDRRMVHISLTNEGRQIVNQSPFIADNLLIKSLNMLSENKLHIIASGLAQLVNILESENISPALHLR
jgi:DNA-binding MarR family transcriptional regulator